MNTIETDFESFLNATLNRVLSRSEDRRRRWEEWAAGQPAEQCCERHGIRRPIDPDRSIHRSFVEREFVVIYQDCPDCARLAAAVEANRWLHERGVPDVLCHASFANFDSRSDADQRIVEAARKFARARTRRGFLVLLGPQPGIGKSHLAVSVMREMECGLFITAQDMVLRVRESYRNRRVQDVVERCRQARLLVLDDLGAMGTTASDEARAIYGILEHRHAERMPTVITSNHAREGFKEFIGVRLVDRLREASKTYELVGESMRPSRKPAYFDD